MSISTVRHVPACPGHAPFRLKLFPIYLCGSGPSSKAWFPGPTRVHIPNGTSIGSGVFARITVVTDRPTNRPCYFVYSNRRHLVSAETRPKISIWKFNFLSASGARSWLERHHAKFRCDSLHRRKEMAIFKVLYCDFKIFKFRGCRSS